MIRLQKLRGLLRANIEIRDARNSLRHTDWTNVKMFKYDMKSTVYLQKINGILKLQICKEI